MDKIKLSDIDPKKHLCVSQQFSEQYIEELFELTSKIKNNSKDFDKELENKIVSMLFYEASTRTDLSFQSAVKRLGGTINSVPNPSQFSSAKKGETLRDTVMMLNSYGDFHIIRHPDNDFSRDVIEKTTKPFINAGSGTTQHPTQSLLDIYTVYENFRRLDNLRITICGDLFRGRTVDSLVYILSKYKNNKFIFVSPKNSKIKPELKKYLEDKNINFTETEDLERSLKESDVFYMTRIQKERFEKEEEYEEAKGKFKIDLKNINLMPEKSILLHPLPRVDEISEGVDKNFRAKYFEQAENGVYIRMAVLKILNDNA
jgi:aspartate carbamoyltransferase catalytic subunit